MQAVEGQQHLGGISGDGRQSSSSQVAHCHLAGICLFSLQTKFPWHCAARLGGEHPWWLGSPGSCCCHRGAKHEVTARCLEAAGANSLSQPPAWSSQLTANAGPTAPNHPSAANTHFPLLLPHSFHLLSSSVGDKPTAGTVLLCQGSAESLCQGLPPQPCKPSQQHCWQGRAGSMKFPVIPEPAQMSPLSFCCAGSLPAPCHSLHSTGCWRGVQTHKPEPPMAVPSCPPTSARSLPISGRIPPASLSLGVFQSTISMQALTSSLPHPCRCHTWVRPPCLDGSRDCSSHRLHRHYRACWWGLENNSAKDLRTGCSQPAQGQAGPTLPCWGSGIRAGMAAQVLLENPRTPRLEQELQAGRSLEKPRQLLHFSRQGQISSSHPGWRRETHRQVGQTGGSPSILLLLLMDPATKIPPPAPLRGWEHL